MNPIFEGQQVGLVLAGGGAKGAYQAGCLQAFAEHTDLAPTMIAGTSIGCLNGAVLASDLNFSSACRRLLELWADLGTTSLLKPVSESRNLIKSLIGDRIEAALRSFGLVPENSIFDPAPLEQALRNAVDADRLRDGLPLWATVFPSAQLPFVGDHISRLAADLVSLATGTEAEYHLVNQIRDNDLIYEVLLASAAIPIAFPRRTRDGRKYVDGGLKDNVPIRALRNAGCDLILVIHLGQTAFVDRWSTTSPDTCVIEIHPTSTMTSGAPVVGDFVEMFNFDASAIRSRVEAGYRDAMRCLAELGARLHSVRIQSAMSRELRDSTRQLEGEPPL